MQPGALNNRPQLDKVKTQNMDSGAAAAEALEQKNNRPQDSFYDTSTRAAKALGIDASHTLMGGAKAPDSGGPTPEEQEADDKATAAAKGKYPGCGPM